MVLESVVGGLLYWIPVPVQLVAKDAFARFVAVSVYEYPVGQDCISWIWKFSKKLLSYSYREPGKASGQDQFLARLTSARRLFSTWIAACARVGALRTACHRVSAIS